MTISKKIREMQATNIVQYIMYENHYSNREFTYSIVKWNTEKDCKIEDVVKHVSKETVEMVWRDVVVNQCHNVRYEKMIMVGMIIRELEVSDIITHTHRPYIELVDLALQLEHKWLLSNGCKTFYEFVYDKLIEMENE